MTGELGIEVDDAGPDDVLGIFEYGEHGLIMGIDQGAPEGGEADRFVGDADADGVLTVDQRHLAGKVNFDQFTGGDGTDGFAHAVGIGLKHHFALAIAQLKAHMRRLECLMKPNPDRDLDSAAAGDSGDGLAGFVQDVHELNLGQFIGFDVAGQVSGWGDWRDNCWGDSDCGSWHRSRQQDWRLIFELFQHFGFVQVEHGLGCGVHHHIAMFEQNRPIAQPKHGGGVVGDEQNRDAPIAQVANPLETFLLKIDVPHGQGFIDDQDIRIGVDDYGKGEADEHPTGVGFDGLFQHVADVCKGGDRVESIGDFGLAQAQNSPVEKDILTTGEFGIEAAAEFQECSDPAPRVDLACGRSEGTDNQLE